MPSPLKTDILWDKMRAAMDHIDPGHRSLEATFQFVVKKQGQLIKKVTVDFKNLKVVEENQAEMDAIITIEDDVLMAIAKRQMSFLDAIKQHKAEASGDIDIINQLIDKFPK